MDWVDRYFTFLDELELSKDGLPEIAEARAEHKGEWGPRGQTLIDAELSRLILGGRGTERTELVMKNED